MPASDYSLSTNKNSSTTTVFDCETSHLKSLLEKFNLGLKIVSNTESIPGSYWGDSEAGLIKNTVFVRVDTPIHSLLHESCHYICMDEQRRRSLDTDAEGDYDEENGVCYLQILLADDLPEMDKETMMQDMDNWGYTFRLGSSNAWFNNDAEDTVEWLKKHKLINELGQVNYQLRA